jgi:DNA-binding NtrC family response regulator
MSSDPGWIAVVEDDPIMGESLQRALELEGWRTTWWRTGEDAVRLVNECAPDLVLCDIRLGDMNGEEVFRVANSHSAAPPFIFMTAYGQIDQAVSLMRAGAYDYLTKPFELESLLQKAREIVALRPRDVVEGVLGISPQMRRIEGLLRRMAPRSLPILITGETGSGKEVCAQFLHRLSATASSPFMAVNCAAIPSELLESELFGHEKGAFSGAHQRHLGYAERARDGVLFLDEIGDMPLSLQAKLLRVLEGRAFHRVGGEASIPLRARIVCATSANLAEFVRAGRLREDLLYRINAVSVEVPPLRNRPEDISWLLSHYFTAFAQQGDRALRGVSSLAEQVALAHPWRGNARELRNRVERAIALAVGPWLMPVDLFPEFQDKEIGGVDYSLPLAAIRDTAEKRQIEHILRETDGQIAEAARRLNISRTTLWEKMRRYGLGVGEAS